jgi:hypothetical protein
MAERQGKQREPAREDARAGGDAGEAAGPLPAIPELVRKAIAAGFSGFFFTEEVIRRAVGDALPREWADFASEQSARARSEFVERLSYEIGRALANVDHAAVLAQLLEGRTLEVNAKIRLHDDRARGRRPRLRVEVSPEDEPR